MSIKNSTLRRRTKELTECADDAREYQLFGYELKELGSLIVSMAIHMGNLQRKIDSQVKHIKDLNEKLIDRKTEPQTSGLVWTEDAIKNEPKSYTTWASTDEPQTYITEDRDTQILDAWQVHHRASTTAVEDEP